MRLPDTNYLRMGGGSKLNCLMGVARGEEPRNNYNHRFEVLHLPSLPIVDRMFVLVCPDSLRLTYAMRHNLESQQSSK